jgi:hypothetical protein
MPSNEVIVNLVHRQDRCLIYSAKAMAGNGNRPTTEEIYQALADRGRPPLRELLPAMLLEIGCIEEAGGWKWQSRERILTPNCTNA